MLFVMGHPPHLHTKPDLYECRKVQRFQILKWNWIISNCSSFIAFLLIWAPQLYGRVRWVGVSGGMLVPHMHTHTHVHRQTHMQLCKNILVLKLQMAAFMGVMFVSMFNVCVCAYVHAHVCVCLWVDPHAPRYLPPSCSLPRAREPKWLKMQ